jgi:hypothetical protein
VHLIERIAQRVSDGAYCVDDRVPGTVCGDSRFFARNARRFGRDAYLLGGKALDLGGLALPLSILPDGFELSATAIAGLARFLRELRLFRVVAGSLRGHALRRSAFNVLTAFVHDITCRNITPRAAQSCPERDAAFVPLRSRHPIVERRTGVPFGTASL